MSCYWQTGIHLSYFIADGLAHLSKVDATWNFALFHCINPFSAESAFF
jgi:hypothetical protein